MEHEKTDIWSSFPIFDEFYASYILCPWGMGSSLSLQELGMSSVVSPFSSDRENVLIV